MLAVEVEEMLCCIGDPDFRLPGDGRQILSHRRAIEERRNDGQAVRRSREEVLGPVVAQHVQRTVRRDGFDEDQPVRST